MTVKQIHWSHIARKWEHQDLIQGELTPQPTAVLLSCTAMALCLLCVDMWSRGMLLEALAWCSRIQASPLSWGPSLAQLLGFARGWLWTHIDPQATRYPAVSAQEPRGDFCSLGPRRISNDGSIIIISLLTASCTFKSHLFNERWPIGWIQETRNIVMCHVFSLLGCNH